MSVAGHHLPIWFDEATGPADGDVSVWNSATGRFESAPVVGGAVPDGTYVPAATHPLEPVDVTKYGVVADNATINTAALQSIITDLDTSKEAVFIPPKAAAARILTGSLTLKADLCFQGWGAGVSTQEPRAASRLKLANGANASMFVIPDGATGITFDRVRLEGNKANQSGTSHGIELVDGAAGQDVFLDLVLCHISGFLTDGLYQGLFRRAINVVRSYIFQSGRHGLNLRSSDNLVDRAVVGLNVSTGVKIDTASVQHIVNSDIFRNGIGIEAVGGADIAAVTIQNTTCDRNDNEGMYLDVGAALVEGCFLNANSTVTVGKSHITLRNTATNRFALVGNTFDHFAPDFPANQVSNSVFFSGTTGPVDFDANTRYSRADVDGLSNAPEFLQPSSAKNPLGHGIVTTVDPRLGFTVAAWPGANRGIFMRCQGGGPISKIGFEVGTASGNVSGAVYRNTGDGRAAVPTGAPVATSGSVACPASGYGEVTLGSTVTVRPGDWLFLSCDNTTATFGRHATPTGSNVMLGFIRRQDSAHPAPTVGALQASAYSPVLIGVP